MPPKRKKFESTFPAARIKKIMQLDDDVGRVASSVPVVISRAVEIFLRALLTRADHFAAMRNAKTLSVNHLKHCIEQEKQWDFLKELTAKIPDIAADLDESEEPPPSRRGRKRRASPGRGKAPASKKKQKPKAIPVEQGLRREEMEEVEEEEEEEEGEETEHSGSVTPEPSASSAHLALSARLAGGSNLAKTSISAHPLFPGSSDAGVLGHYQKTQLGGAGASVQGSSPLSIPALIAAGSTSARPQDDSDDDYD